MASVLAILLSKQVDLRINGGEDTSVIFPCYDAVLQAIQSQEWSRIVTNSRIIAAAFGLPTYPRRYCWNLQDVYPLLLSCSHVVCFHGGGPKFGRVLRSISTIGRKRKCYLVDLKHGGISRHSLTALE
jgi:hypothetical protein